MARNSRHSAPDLTPQAGWRPSGTPAHQTVQGAWVLATSKTSEGRWLATVVARVQTTTDRPQSRTLYLAVPLAQTKTGALVVADYPALLPAPPHPDAVAIGPEGALTSDDRAPALMQAFFAAYFSGGDTRYFLTPDTKLTGSPKGFTLAEVGKLQLRKTDANLWADVPVTVTDSLTGSSLTLRYTLALTEKDGRLYIQDLLQKGAY